MSPLDSIKTSNPLMMAAAKLAGTSFIPGGGNIINPLLGKGTKYGKICVMDENLRQEYLKHKSENPNLTWTPVTESNIGSLCQDPTEQNFQLMIGGGCVGYTQTYANVTSKSDDFIEYASLCKITVLTCGRVNEPIECDVYKFQPEPHNQQPMSTKTILPASTFGTKSIKTMYSKEVLPGIKWCENNGSIKHTYHYFYSTGASYVKTFGCYCGGFFMNRARRENEYFIVTKKGK